MTSDPLRYFWRAIYEDGSRLDQFDVTPDGLKPNSYGDIDRELLRQFQLIETATLVPKITIHLKPEMKLIHRRRRFKRVIMSVGRKKDGEPFADVREEPRLEETTWIVGVHQKRGGLNFQTVLILFEDGQIELLDRWHDDYAPYCKPDLRPEETFEDDLRV